MNQINEVSGDDMDADALKNKDINVEDLARAYGLTIGAAQQPLFVDTVAVVAQLIAISNKLLPVKSYYNVCQSIQLKKFYAKWLVDLTNPNASQEEKNRMLIEVSEYDESIIMRKIIDAKNMALAATESVTAKRVKKESLEYARVKNEALAHCASEELFLMACIFVNAEIAKQGHIYYMEGKSFDFKETKKKRIPCDLTKPLTIEKLLDDLREPDENRGKIERYAIDQVGFNNLAKRIALSLKKDAVFEYMTTRNEKQNFPRNFDVMQKFNIKRPLDLQFIVDMLKNEGRLTENNSKIRSENKYTLKTLNHKRIEELAKRSGISKNAALDKIIEGYFKLLEIERQRRLNQKNYQSRVARTLNQTIEQTHGDKE